MDWPLFACAAIGYSLPRPRLHRVGIDAFQNMLLALRTLKRLGYSRIGLAMGRHINARVDGRYVAAHLSYHHHFRQKNIVPMLLPEVLDGKNLISWCRKYHPDAIITNEERITSWLHQAGFDVPGEMGVVHISRPPKPQTLAGIDTNPILVGAVAVELVEAQLHRNERGIPAEPRAYWSKVNGATVPACANNSVRGEGQQAHE